MVNREQLEDDALLDSLAASTTCRPVDHDAYQPLSDTLDCPCAVTRFVTRTGVKQRLLLVPEALQTEATDA